MTCRAMTKCRFWRAGARRQSSHGCLSASYSFSLLTCLWPVALHAIYSAFPGSRLARCRRLPLPLRFSAAVRPRENDGSHAAITPSRYMIAPRRFSPFLHATPGFHTRCVRRTRVPVAGNTCWLAAALRVSEQFHAYRWPALMPFRAQSRA